MAVKAVAGSKSYINDCTVTGVGGGGNGDTKPVIVLSYCETDGDAGVAPDESDKARDSVPAVVEWPVTGGH